MSPGILGVFCKDAQWRALVYFIPLMVREFSAVMGVLYCGQRCGGPCILFLASIP